MSSSIDPQPRSGANLAEDDPRHGSENAYGNLGCRCDDCREAHRVHYAEKRAEAAESRTCPNCGGPGGLAKDGACSACASYKRATGHYRPPKLYDKKPIPCGVPYCPNEASARSLCMRHYGRWRRGSSLLSDHEEALLDEVERLREALDFGGVA